MAGKFADDQRSCEECGKGCPAQDSQQDTARYTLRRNLCSTCAGGDLADTVLDGPTSTSQWRCSEHRHRDVILYCVNCRRPICDVCVHLTHSGHEYRDISKVIKQRRDTARTQCERIAEKEQQLRHDRRIIEECIDDVNGRFDRLRYAVLVRVHEKSRSLEEDQTIAARKIESRAREEKQKIDRWKDNRLAELREEKDNKSREIQQRQCNLFSELDDVKRKLLDQLDEYQDFLEKADEIVANARKAAEGTLSADVKELLSLPTTPDNAVLEECLALELDVESVSMVDSIAKSVKFESESASDNCCLLGKLVTTAPAWCKIRNIQVGLPNFRLLNSTKANNRVLFTGENGDKQDKSFGLYTMDVESGATNLVTSDSACITDAASLSNDLIAVTRNDKSTVNVWHTKRGKVSSHFKVPKNWSHTRLAVDHDGSIVARDHASNTYNKINVYRSTTGEKIRSIPYSGTIYNLATLSSGKLVIQSGATEVTIVDQSGLVMATISDESWQWVRCAVARDDAIMVAYGRRDDSTTIFVDAYSNDGRLVERVVKHRCNPSLDHIALVVTMSGRIALQKGDDLAIYERLIPLVPVMTSTTPDNISEKSSNSPKPPSRRNIFMCIPT
ncbi:uncharacterized protein [Diadema setosum]|uniref:uncharacterized protein n=1 Tax=Diadema setosum TaxID=31175 RepID=UPI003B3BC5E4